MLIDEWANDPTVTWNSLVDPLYTISTVSATDRFDIDFDTVRKVNNDPSQPIRIIHTDGNAYTEYTLVSPSNLYTLTGNYCAIVNKQLAFKDAFTSSDPQFGGSIRIPVTLAPDKLTSSTTDVPVDDPNWLVVRTSSEYVRNDITRQQHYQNLLNEAEALLNAMKDANDPQQDIINPVKFLNVRRGYYGL